MSPVKRRRRLSDSTLHPTRSSVDNSSDSASTTHSTQSLPTIQPTAPVVIRPLPRVLPSPPTHHHHHHHTTIPIPQTATNYDRRDHILAESLLQVTREKEAGRMKRSQDMLQFLREKQRERDQLLIEKELTKRLKAKAELVKNLMDAGFDKAAIAEQLAML
jgi:hypothetical protein